jgi:CTD nuclear envelope phosphatase 1
LCRRLLCRFASHGLTDPRAMNSLNILSAIAPSAPSSPQRSRSGSASKDQSAAALARRASEPQLTVDRDTPAPERDNNTTTTVEGGESSMDADEHSPLLGQSSQPDHFGDVKIPSGWRSIPKRISSAIIGTVRVFITTIAAPGRYVIACFYDEEGAFSPFLPIIAICRLFTPKKRKRNAQALNSSEKPDSSREGRNGGKPRPPKQAKRPSSVASSSTAVASDSEFDEKLAHIKPEPPRISKMARARSSLSTDGDEIAPARRSIRIKLHNEEVMRRRRKQSDGDSTAQPSREDANEVIAATLKSPSSPAASKLKFPRAPIPPRPLIPRRQPSYANNPAVGPHQKTLIIDLDETLIHSHSKGGRFATGHMVEVKISHSIGIGGTVIGPQVPILYYVHKRPYCDEFLRKVGKASSTSCLTRS